MSDKPSEDFFKSRSDLFGNFTDQDDFLHPQQPCVGDSCTETQYFGFRVAEANIFAFAYLWLHPNLKTVMGGLVVCQGLKHHHLQAELIDFRQNLSYDTVIKDDLRTFKLPNSYQVDVLTPGKRMRMRYDDPTRENHVALDITAVSPVAMRANNKHFEQAMRYEGELILRGKKYRVDCINVRDRSWGEQRPEDPLHYPPLTWATGSIGDNFSFNCSAFDHPDLKPNSLSHFPMTPEQAFNDGWIYADKTLVKLTSIVKLTQRDPKTGRPVSHVIEAIDRDGRRYRISGEITAGITMSFWPNCVTHLCMTKWEYDGLIGWGDTQETHWTDYIREYTV